MWLSNMKKKSEEENETRMKRTETAEHNLKEAQARLDEATEDEKKMA